MFPNKSGLIQVNCNLFHSGRGKAKTSSGFCRVDSFSVFLNGIFIKSIFVRNMKCRQGRGKIEMSGQFRLQI